MCLRFADGSVKTLLLAYHFYEFLRLNIDFIAFEAVGHKVLEVAAKFLVEVLDCMVLVGLEFLFNDVDVEFLLQHDKLEVAVVFTVGLESRQERYDLGTVL